VLKTVNHLLQAGAYLILLGIARLLPIAWSSAIGGALTRNLRFFLKERKVGLENLNLAFPDMSEEIKVRIATAVWDNLGRTGLEFLAIHKISQNFDKHVSIEGAAHIETLKQSSRPVLIASGHFANWNVILMTVMRVVGDAVAIYRPVNNPYLDRIIREQYQYIAPRSLAKGETLAKMTNALRQGAPIAMLADQHMSGGLEVMFFGQKVLAPAGPATLAIRAGAGIIPMHCRRDPSSGIKPHFTVSFGAPLVSHKESRKEQIIDLTQQYYSYLEDEIRKYPESWLWLHARFSKYQPPQPEIG